MRRTMRSARLRERLDNSPASDLESPLTSQKIIQVIDRTGSPFIRFCSSPFLLGMSTGPCDRLDDEESRVMNDVPVELLTLAHRSDHTETGLQVAASRGKGDRDV